jgi:hypothetical protein
MITGGLNNMAKKVIGLIFALAILLAVFGLTACTNSHGIPNGKYVSTDGSSANSTLLRDGILDYDYYWRIKGDKATWYASGLKSNEYKIIQEGDKLFFANETKKLEVKYDDFTKNLTILSMTFY